MILLQNEEGTEVLTISNAVGQHYADRVVIMFPTNSRVTLRINYNSDPSAIPDKFIIDLGGRTIIYDVVGQSNEFDITSIVRSLAALRDETSIQFSSGTTSFPIYAMLVNAVATTKEMIDISPYLAALIGQGRGMILPPSSVVLDSFYAMKKSCIAEFYLGNDLTVGGGLSYSATYGSASLSMSNPYGWYSVGGRRAEVKASLPCDAFGPNASFIYVLWQFPYMVGSAEQLKANGRRLVRSCWRIESITSERTILSSNNLVLAPSRESGEALYYTISLNGLRDYDVWYYSRIVLSDLVYIGAESGNLPPCYRCEVADKSVRYSIKGEQNGKVTVKLKVITEDLFQEGYNLDF